MEAVVDNRITLNPIVVAAMADAARVREQAIISDVLQVPDYPPLSPCPECGVAAERVDSMLEPPAFGVDEAALLINFSPCGHRFRSVQALDEPA
jgi:hypothetical protein